MCRGYDSWNIDLSFGFLLQGFPYAGLTAVLTAAFAFVPYIGGFSPALSALLFTLLAAPNKALLCLIVYQATQFVENQFIYPHVVGNSVGLSPFWTLLAVLLGGKLFGVLGMIFFIPLMALVSQLLHESIERRLHTANGAVQCTKQLRREYRHISMM